MKETVRAFKPSDVVASFARRGVVKQPATEVTLSALARDAVKLLVDVVRVNLADVSHKSVLLFLRPDLAVLLADFLIKPLLNRLVECDTVERPLFLLAAPDFLDKRVERARFPVVRADDGELTAPNKERHRRFHHAFHVVAESRLVKNDAPLLRAQVVCVARHSHHLKAGVEHDAVHRYVLLVVLNDDFLHILCSNIKHLAGKKSDIGHELPCHRLVVREIICVASSRLFACGGTECGAV